MPHYRVSEELLEELGESSDSGGVYYEDAAAKFDFEKAEPYVQTIRNELMGKGFESVKCKYDGGHDEGFAYFQSATVNGVVFTPDELAELLKATPVADAAMQIYDSPDYPPAVRKRLQDRLAARSEVDRILELLDNFAMTLAIPLLGKGFGTGEYELRGNFRAELSSGEIEDIEQCEGGW